VQTKLLSVHRLALAGASLSGGGGGGGGAAGGARIASDVRAAFVSLLLQARIRPKEAVLTRLQQNKDSVFFSATMRRRPSIGMTGPKTSRGLPRAGASRAAPATRSMIPGPPTPPLFSSPLMTKVLQRFSRWCPHALTLKSSPPLPSVAVPSSFQRRFAPLRGMTAPSFAAFSCPSMSAVWTRLLRWCCHRWLCFREPRHRWMLCATCTLLALRTLT